MALFRKKEISKSDLASWPKESRDYYLNNQKYKSTFDNYYNTLHKIQDTSKRINHKKKYHTLTAMRHILLCKKAIRMTSSVSNAFKSMGESTPEFPAFRYLAIIYEKRGEYHKAVHVCKDAIRRGLIADGTKGGMIARVERLKKRKKS